MKLNIWLILDGKRGHEKQIEDLTFSLRKKIKINITKIKKISFLDVFLNFLGMRNDQCKYFQKPDLIIAAGHHTHLDALQKKFRYGGKVIIIMKSSIPSFFFDLSIIPSHDKLFWKKNILTIDGPINNIINKKKQKIGHGIILVGGPSKNYYWETKEIINKIRHILIANKKIQFTLVTSRRTPKNFIKNFLKENFIDLRIVTPNSVPKDWLANEIEKYELSWVTQDSISMLYELIFSGSKVTSINLKNKNNKFLDLYTMLYKSKKINISNLPIQKIVPSNVSSSNSDTCANFIIKNLLT